MVGRVQTDDIVEAPRPQALLVDARQQRLAVRDPAAIEGTLMIARRAVAVVDGCGLAAVGGQFLALCSYWFEP